MPCVQVPWYKLPRTARLTIGWLCLLGIVFGSAFGFPLTGVRSVALNFFGQADVAIEQRLWTSSNFSTWVVCFPVRFLLVFHKQIRYLLVGICLLQLLHLLI
jgi:CNT family concentrative nucleoside transporter